MFTGLVEELGIISKITQTEIWIEASVVMKDLGIKDSISVNGACLTVVDLKENTFRQLILPDSL